MARWETSVLESPNQLYPDCFFIDAKNYKNWWLMGLRCRKNNIIHGVPGFLLAGESGGVIEVAGVCQTSLASLYTNRMGSYLERWKGSLPPKMVK